MFVILDFLSLFSLLSFFLQISSKVPDTPNKKRVILFFLLGHVT